MSKIQGPPILADGQGLSLLAGGQDASFLTDFHFSSPYATSAEAFRDIMSNAVSVINSKGIDSPALKNQVCLGGGALS